MSEWKEYKLGDIATFSQGIQIDIENQFSESFEDCVRFIRIVDFTKGTENEIRYIKNPGEKYIVKSDDLVMIRYGSQTAGKIARGFSGAIANNTFKISMDEKKSDKNFIYYFLSQQSIFNFFHNSQSSSTMPAITFGMIGDLDIELPPLPEQKTIASILSSLDDKIDLLHRQNSTLEKMAETLFRQWFVEEAKDDWAENNIGDISDIKAGGDKPKIYSEIKTEECKVPIYSNGIEKEGLYGFTDTARIIDECITISARGTIGFVCLRHEPFVPIVRLISIVPNEKYLSSKYLYFWAKLQSISGTGTTQEQLTVPDLSRTTIILPPFEKMMSFTNHANNLFNKIITNQTQIRTLTALRDTLLPKLMSGELRVKN